MPPTLRQVSSVQYKPTPTRLRDSCLSEAGQPVRHAPRPTSPGVELRPRSQSRLPPSVHSPPRRLFRSWATTFWPDLRRSRAKPEANRSSSTPGSLLSARHEPLDLRVSL